MEELDGAVSKVVIVTVVARGGVAGVDADAMAADVDWKVVSGAVKTDGGVVVGIVVTGPDAAVIAVDSLADAAIR